MNKPSLLYSAETAVETGRMFLKLLSLKPTFLVSGIFWMNDRII